MSVILFKISIKIKSWFVKKPSNKLNWNIDDYHLGKKWAKSQYHPFIKNKTLWDFCYDKQESLYTIDNLNKFLVN
jgi:hypothetical protein